MRGEPGLGHAGYLDDVEARPPGDRGKIDRAAATQRERESVDKTRPPALQTSLGGSTRTDDHPASGLENPAKFAERSFNLRSRMQIQHIHAQHRPKPTWRKR